MARSGALLVGLIVVSGCEGSLSGMMPASSPSGGGTDAIGGSGGGGVFIAPSPAALFTEAALGSTPIQRLTHRQLLREVERLFQVSSAAAGELAPVDSPSSTWFDNDANALSFSAQGIESYELFARSIGAQVRASNAVVLLAGCTPSGPADAACYRQFVSRVGRLTFRRALTAQEVQKHVDTFLPFAVEDRDFGTAVELTVSAWLQHPEFLYRIEHGDPAAGRPTLLSATEVANRIAFLITGTGPDEALLDAAAAGALDSAAGRVAQAERLLGTTAAREERRWFHARWLGYGDRFLNPALERDARAETDALIDRITGDDTRDWLTLLTSTETFVTPSLATHYTLPIPGGAGGWVAYPAGRGGGVLSHLTVANLGSKFGDTSPTLRGYELFKRLTCGALSGEIPPGLDTSVQPGSATDCKPKRYVMRTLGACQGCHLVTDNIGFGLENLGADGQWRTQETTNPSCSVSGTGSIDGVDFTGPGQLGALFQANPRVAQCATRQLFQAFLGRAAEPNDAATIEALAGQYFESHSYPSLVLALVRSPAITFKGAN